MEFGR